jgi:hypothetical protein
MVTRSKYYVNLPGNGRRPEEYLQKQLRKSELQWSDLHPRCLVRFSCDDKHSGSGNFLSQFNDSDLLKEARILQYVLLLPMCYYYLSREQLTCVLVLGSIFA